MKSTCLFVGVGNPYRSDDGVGAFVAERLRQAEAVGLDILTHRGEGAALLDLWAGYEQVILCDAVRSGAPPGQIHRFCVPPDQLPREVFHCSTHVFSVVDVMELAKALGQLPASVRVIGIEGQAFDHGEGLSPTVAQAALTVVAELLEEVEGLKP